MISGPLNIEKYFLKLLVYIYSLSICFKKRGIIMNDYFSIDNRNSTFT